MFRGFKDGDGTLIQKWKFRLKQISIFELIVS